MPELLNVTKILPLRSKIQATATAAEEYKPYIPKMAREKCRSSDPG